MRNEEEKENALHFLLRVIIIPNFRFADLLLLYIFFHTINKYLPRLQKT
jgi:hypothetical protein